MLQQAIIPLSLAQGIDTKTDPKQVQMGRLLALQNGIFVSPGRIRKRNGYQGLSQSVMGGSPISAGRSLFQLGNRLLLHDGTNLFSYADSESQWVKTPVRQGNMASSGAPACKVTQDLLAQWPFAPGYPDMTIHSSGLGCLAWENQQGAPGVYYMLFDSVSGTQVQPPVLYPLRSGNNRTQQRAPKVVSAGKWIVVVCIQDTHISTLWIDSTAPLSAPILVNAVDSLPTGSAGTFDVTSTSTQVIIASNATTTIKITTVQVSTQVVANPFNITIANSASSCLTIFPAGSNFALGYSDGGFTYVCVLTGALSGLAMTVTAIEGVAAQQITGSLDAGGNIVMFYARFGSGGQTDVSNYFIRTRTAMAALNGTFSGTPVDCCRSVGLAGKAFLYNGVVYVLACHDSTLQPGYFLLDQSGQPVAKALPGAAVGQPQGPDNATGTNLLPEANLSSGVAQYALQSVSLSAPSTFSNIQFDFNEAIGSAALANTLHFGGGQMWMYDGNRAVEHGFHLFPEDLTGTGPGGNNSYHYVGCYEWTDSQGNVHRSAPSLPVTVLRNQAGTSGVTGRTSTNIQFVNYVETGGNSYNNTVGPGFNFITMGPLTVTAGNTILMTYTVIDNLGYFPNVTITDNIGNTYTPALSTTNYVLVGGVFQSWQVGILYANNVKAGSSTFTITVNGGTSGTVQFGAFQYSGVSSVGTSPLDSGSQAAIDLSGTATSVTVNFTPSNPFPGDLTFAYGINGLGTGGTGFTAGYNLRNPNDRNWTVIDNLNTGTGAHSITFTPTSATEVAALVVTLFPSVSITTGAATVLTIPTLRLTSKQDMVSTGGAVYPGGLVKIVIYRTTANGTVYYRCIAPGDYGDPINDPTADAVSFLDVTEDSEITSHPVLYTTGNILPNDPADPPGYMQQIRNRVWYIDSTNPYRLGFSKLVVPGAPVEFADTLEFILASHGGEAVALANLDDRVIVLKQSSVSYIQGDGPSDNGLNNDFREVPIPTDVGCVDPGSVITGGAGCMFKTAKGFFMLNRSLEVQYIGADVEAFNQYTVTSAQIIPQSNWIVFTLSNGTALLFDYYVNQWSTFTNISAVDTTLHNNLFTYVNSSGLVQIETPGVFSDNGAYIPLSLTTSWIQVAGISGFQRLWRFIILGEWLSAHSLVVNLRYDYDPGTLVQTVTFDGTTSMVPYQWRVDLEKQQCQAIQIQLTEQQNGPIGEGLNLSGISMEIGQKRGIFKLPAAQTKG